MGTLRGLKGLVFCIPLSLLAFAQSSPFVGTWETHESLANARAAITLVIVQNGEVLAGTVYLAHFHDSGSDRLNSAIPLKKGLLFRSRHRWNPQMGKTGIGP